MAAASRTIGPLTVRAQSGGEIVSEILAARGQPVQIAFANTHLLYFALRDADVAAALRNFVILNDGIGLTLISRLVAGAGFPENLNGTDFTPRLLGAAAQARVFLVGAAPDIAAQAALALHRLYPGITICGVRDGFDEVSDDELAREIDDGAPDFILVAMGNPKQELWIQRMAPRLRPSVLIGVGALFDFLAEEKRRAPIVLQHLHLEWLYRLAQEPSRLWRRYTIEILYVLVALLRTRRFGRAQ